jgi:hypothetical protein
LEEDTLHRDGVIPSFYFLGGDYVSGICQRTQTIRILPFSLRQFHGLAHLRFVADLDLRS